MDPRTIILYLLYLCIIGSIGVDSSEEPIFRSDPTIPTIFSTPITDIESSESRYSSRSRKVQNNFHDESVEDNDVDGAPPDHLVPYSAHENPEEPSTKPKYTSPGDWAKPKTDRDIPLNFVPTKLYAQVRGTHTVKRLPREEALKSAETPEELLAAPRLREVVSKSKTNTIYTEEGYEDAAYDHAGHIRDADFHEGFARKLEDEQKIGKEKIAKIDKSEDAEESNDYDDDYSSHAEESSKIENTQKSIENYKKLKNLLKNSDVDPKQVTENEIEKLEKDLNDAYEESAKNTETEVPENLKTHPGNDEDEDPEDDESSSEDEAKNLRDYGKRMRKKIEQSEEASRAMLEDTSGERIESQGNEIKRALPISEKNSAESEKSDNSDDILSTPNYGKLFWDYYKTDASNWNPRDVTTPKILDEIPIQTKKSVPEISTSVSSFPSVKSTIGSYDTFTFTPPSTELTGFTIVTGNTNSFYPSATSFYESWKRRDLNPSTEDNSSQESFKTSNLDPLSTVQSAEFDNDPTLSLHTDQTTTTLSSPKKLSYTMIIRSNEKKTTRGPPCDHENHPIAEESKSVEKSGEKSVEKSAYPSYPELSNQFEEVRPSMTNANDPTEQDFTVIRPPLPVPLGQVTFVDFPPDPYRNLVHPSVTQESQRHQFDAQEITGERDAYRLSESPYDYPVQNHVSHGSEGPRVRHHRGPPPGRKRNRYPLLTKLVPPPPDSRSKYAEYLGIQKNSKPRTRFHRSSSTLFWPDLINIYRSIDRTIFGRRRRRSIIEELTITASSNREKVNDKIVDGSRETNLSRGRNFFHEGTNRLVAASITGKTTDDNPQLEKSNIAEIRKKRSDDLLNDSPRIAEEVINAEIESRFKDEEDDKENSKNEDDSSERAKVEIEVPEFNFTEVIESNERQKAIITQPSKGPTLNKEKYPFYANSKVSRNSALQYITNPRQVPRKTHGGTEFYDSRDKYLECADVEPDLEKVVPEEEEPNSDRKSQGDQMRLRGLGDKLDCFRAKYFDENPLDNPLFLEKQVGEPRVPEEFDLAKFTSRIIEIPTGNSVEEQIVRRSSRKPEVSDNRRSDSKVSEVKRKSDRNRGRRIKNNQSSGRERSGYRGRNRFEEGGYQQKSVQMTTQQPEVAVTPYQREVYEDVMGTIKNMAGMYQAFGESVPTPSFESHVNHPPVTRKSKDRNHPLVHKTAKPRGFTIRGLLPPQPNDSQARQRYRIIPYRTNKVSYGTRPRIDKLGTDGANIGYFKTVKVHKRSLDEPFDLDAEESRMMVKRNSTEDTSEPAASEKIVYTIRDRIRHSKPRGDSGRNGRYSNLEAAGTEDIRRREPRYNRIRSRNGPSSTKEPATTTYWETSDTTKSEEPTVQTPRRSVSSEGTPRQDFHDEPGETYKIQYSTPQKIEALPIETRRRSQLSPRSDDYDEETELDEDTTRSNNYDVREDPEEEVTPAPAVTKLEKYLESDPPGYAEAFGEESTESSDRYTEEEDTSREPENYDNPDKEDDEEEEDEQIEKPSESYVEEESSPDSAEAEEESDSPRQSESYKNSDDDDEENNEEEKDDSPKDEENAHIESSEQEFERFASRPYSPFESNEDPKYADLGPRINKPSFHHPTFEEGSSSKHRNRDSGESNYSAESDEDESAEADKRKKSKYVFPWEQDEAEAEDTEESQHSRHSIDRYEYPWEKRARKARERRKKQKEQEKHDKLFGFSESSEEDEEQDASNSYMIRRRVYPWEHYDVPSKNYGRTKAKITKIMDNDEMASEYRPVMKFSSKYKAKSFNSKDDDDPIVVAGADPKEIRVSILKSVEAATKKDKSSETNKNVTVVTSTANPVGPKLPLRKSRNWKSRSGVSTSTTIRSIATQKPRIWRVASSTTKKPIRSRKRLSNIDTELLKSESQRKEVTENPEKINLNSTIISSTASTINRRKIRRRDQPINQTSISTTTSKPIRRRFQKTTQSPKEAEESTTKTLKLRTTTPKSKTVEHRSSFSKEEIITKTSYPRINNEDSNDQKDKKNGVNQTDVTVDGNNRKKLINERIEKVSITMKKTPDHIYRKEEIDKNGVKGMFLSITPNNSTNTTSNEKINAADTNDMLKRFESTEDDVADVEDDVHGSFMHDNYLLANIFKKVPPYSNYLRFDENLQGERALFENEGSGSPDIEDYEEESGNFRPNYIKDPSERLYYYVEK